MAKVILNEQQLNEIAIRGMLSSLFKMMTKDMSREQVNLIKWKIKAMSMVAGSLAVALPIVVPIEKAIKNSQMPDAAKQELLSFTQSLEQKAKEQSNQTADFRQQQANVQANTKTNTSSNHQKKVEAVRKIMEWSVGNMGLSMKDVKLSPEVLVSTCEKYNYDLPLLLAQAHWESHFGVTKRARKTNSVFSVGSYDNGKDVCVYKSQNESVEPYVRLMKRDYLGKSKSVNTLLKNGGFVNFDNKRYASDKNYESKLRGTRNKLIKNYPELM